MMGILGCNIKKKEILVSISSKISAQCIKPHQIKESYKEYVAPKS